MGTCSGGSTGEAGQGATSRSSTGRGVVARGGDSAGRDARVWATGVTVLREPEVLQQPQTQGALISSLDPPGPPRSAESRASSPFDGVCIGCAIAIAIDAATLMGASPFGLVSTHGTAIAPR